MARCFGPAVGTTARLGSSGDRRHLTGTARRPRSRREGRHRASEPVAEGSWAYMDKVADNGERWRTLIGLIGMVGGGLLLVGTIPGQASADPGGPPGNDGTVKVDGEVFDDLPNNEPHVGCVFQVDFYGYDEGQLFADVTFEVQPPTGNEVILEDNDIFIGEDDHSGGGSEAGPAPSRTYDLTSVLANFEPQPQQGFHVKLTVNADGSQGADVKHKTFWVTGCEAPPTTSSSTTSTTEHPTSTT